MHKIFRAIIATVVAIVAVLFAHYAAIMLFDRRIPKEISGIFLMISWGITFALIKPSKKEIEREKEIEANKITKSEIFHENGVLKEKGILKGDKRDGNWDFFNEEGEYIESKIFKNGEIV